MTAPLTTQTGNLSTSGDALTKYRAQERRRGVNLGFGPVPPGQLWERVAEGRVSDDALSYSELYRLAVIRSTLGTHSDVRGPLAWNSGRLTNEGYGVQARDASGIIRAGERVR